jgi:hypothetical protein
MMKIIAALILILAAASGTPAQTEHFTLSGSAVGWMGASSSAPASIAGVSFHLTPRVSLSYEQLTVPTIASFDMGYVRYSLPLSSLIGKKITSHFVFDASKVGVSFKAGGGKVLQSALNVSRIAEAGGISLSYPLANHIDVQVIGVTYYHGGISGTNGLVITPSTAAIASGLAVHF